MMYIRSNKAQSIGGNKVLAGDIVRTSSAHARALTAIGVVSIATPQEIKAVADAKAKRGAKK